MGSIGHRFTVILLALQLFGCSKAQEGHSPELIARLLDPVKEGQYLNDSAWVITIEGDTLPSKQFENKWLLVDYWTAGCLPCIKEFPVMETYYQTMDTSQLQIIMLNIDGKKKKWEKVFKKRKYLMPSYHAGWSSSNKLLAINYQVFENGEGVRTIRTLTPQYVLIDPAGQIVDKNIPKPSDEKFSDIIHNYLGRE